MRDFSLSFDTRPNYFLKVGTLAPIYVVLA